MFTFFTIILLFLLATEWDSPYRDLAEIVFNLHVVIVQSLCNLHDLRTKIAQCCAVSLFVPFAYLKSLWSFFGPKWLSKILLCPHYQRVVPVRGLCNLPEMCLHVTGLHFFKICHSGELNKIVKATIPWIRLIIAGSPCGGRTERVSSSEGKCNWVINRANPLSISCIQWPSCTPYLKSDFLRSSGWTSEMDHF